MCVAHKQVTKRGAHLSPFLIIIPTTRFPFYKNWRFYRLTGMCLCLFSLFSLCHSFTPFVTDEGSTPMGKKLPFKLVICSSRLHEWSFLCRGWYINMEIFLVFWMSRIHAQKHTHSPQNRFVHLWPSVSSIIMGIYHADPFIVSLTPPEIHDLWTSEIAP